MSKLEVKCDYCGKIITRYVSPTWLKRKHIFCDRKCYSKWKIDRRMNPRSAVFVGYRARLCCNTCGFRTEIGNGFKEGDVCPKCELENLVTREEGYSITYAKDEVETVSV